MMRIVKASRAVFLSPTPSVVVKSDCGCCHLFLFSSPPPPPCSSKRQAEKNSLCSFLGACKGRRSWMGPGFQAWPPDQCSRVLWGCSALPPPPRGGGEFCRPSFCFIQPCFLCCVGTRSHCVAQVGQGHRLRAKVIGTPTTPFLSSKI